MWFILGFTAGGVAGVGFSGGNIEHMMTNVIYVVQHTVTYVGHAAGIM